MVMALKELAVIGKWGPMYLMAKATRVDPTITLRRNTGMSFISLLFV